MEHYLVIDCSYMLHRTFFAGWKSSGSEELDAGLALHSAFVTFNKYYNKYNPTKVVCTFDRPNWRAEYTKSDMCLSEKQYKANRRKNMTSSEKRRYDRFKDHVTEFEDLVKEYTSMICLAADMLEADDLIAGFCQMHPDDKTTILSADQDMIQLLRNPNVSIVDPMTDKARVCDDIDWFLFLKYIRGDTGDNVQSAFPRVRETRIRKAFEDEFERLSLMNEVWTNNVSKEFRVGDLFEENKMLMGLSDQPAPVKELMTHTIKSGMESHGKFNYFKFLKFCGKHNLVNIKKGADSYIKLLSC